MRTSQWTIVRNTWLAVVAIGMLGVVVYELSPQHSAEGQINTPVPTLSPKDASPEGFWIGGYLNPETGKGSIREGIGRCPPTISDGSLYLSGTCHQETRLSTPKTIDW